MQVGETSKFYRPDNQAAPSRRNRVLGGGEAGAAPGKSDVWLYRGGQLCYNKIHMGRRSGRNKAAVQT